MSRYLLLILLNLPFVAAGLVGAVTQYKLRKNSRRKFLFQIIAWVGIASSLCLAYPIYSWLFSNNLTETEPLSLFDVVQITAIVFLLYALNSLRTKTEVTEQRLRALHEELSIRMSKD